MKLHLAKAAGQNLFTGYGEDYVVINQIQYDKSLIALPDKLVEDWNVPSFEALTSDHFEFILSLDPEIVLLGTGKNLRFPHPSLTQTLTRNQIGIEIMDIYATCRTYNILMAEGRKVAAALILN
ncbi:Mth938-like domain-containing protein [Sulfurirhabdus autotrophica]|uniref:Xcc1710-like domain-containing protein n=1 Tax=Sulfurirhabdus autotrophica TaxID=1706046 RepID=A0A4R3YEQ5_9PROT|nr:Mth938-like domain-containing protein [Sulfurirhabdus autotrophica]TCV90372.1 uncharacterized protein EDC63_101342 [Sulfurirhabdus autotrophica]